MKDLLSNISDLSRMPLTDLKELLNLIKLASLIYAIDSDENSSENLSIEIPTFGKIVVNENFDFDFVPDADFKKMIYTLKSSPSRFLENELKKVLNIGGI